MVGIELSEAQRYGDSYTPKETAWIISDLGVRKARQSTLQLLVKSFLAGMYLSIGGLFLIILAGGSPGLATNYPGLQKALGAAVFQLDLSSSILALLKSWSLSFLGNLAGAMFFGGVLVYWTAILHDAPYRTYAISLSEHKAAGANWREIFLKVIGCNWAVCIAVWMSASAKDIISKVIIIFLPIWFFVAVGFEHVIANMFLIQMGMYLGTNFGVGYYIWHSMIPVCLGNIVGGGLFVGVAHWYLFLFQGGGEGTSVGAPGLLTRILTGGTKIESSESSDIV